MEQITGTSLSPTEKKKLNVANIVMAGITLLAIAAAVTFGILWGIERNKEPEKIITNDCSLCEDNSNSHVVEDCETNIVIKDCNCEGTESETSATN